MSGERGDRDQGAAGDPRATSEERVTVGPMDVALALARLEVLPIPVWRYRWEPAHVRHVGPVPEELMAAFDLRTEPGVLNLVDVDGVLLACVQSLAARVARLEALIEEGAVRRGPGDGTWRC